MQSESNKFSSGRQLNLSLTVRMFSECSKSKARPSGGSSKGNLRSCGPSFNRGLLLGKCPIVEVEVGREDGQ
jgi:hypothetical protein